MVKQTKGTKKGFNPVYTAYDAATGLYLNLRDVEEPRLACFDLASHYSTHLDVCTALAEVRAPLPGYEVVRVDA